MCSIKCVCGGENECCRDRDMLDADCMLTLNSVCISSIDCMIHALAVGVYTFEYVGYM